jgi:two-component system cell cycle response regulator DivK
MAKSHDSGAFVLVVDDDPGGREVFSAILRAGGYRVAQAHNGLQALEKALSEVPDVIVTDMALPGIDGFELCRRLREHPGTRDVPLVAITGYEKFGYPERAMRAGCYSVLTKPCTSEQLLGEVRRALASRSSHTAT